MVVGVVMEVVVDVGVVMEVVAMEVVVVKYCSVVYLCVR